MTSSSRLTSFLNDFDPDSYECTASAIRLDVDQHDVEQPVHSHKKGQVIMAIRGGITCQVKDAMWMAPPHHAIWIPSGTPHSSRSTENAEIYYVFIDSSETLISNNCCTIFINPLVEELIKHLSCQSASYTKDSQTDHIARVLLEQLAISPLEEYSFTLPHHPKINLIAKTLMDNPADRTSIEQWADRLAMSQRSLYRLLIKETGMTFGKWRQRLHIMVALKSLSGGESVQRVAGDLGYDSVTAFITMFKKYMGKSPTQYLSEIGKR